MQNGLRCCLILFTTVLCKPGCKQQSQKHRLRIQHPCVNNSFMSGSVRWRQTGPSNLAACAYRSRSDGATLGQESPDVNMLMAACRNCRQRLDCPGHFGPNWSVEGALSHHDGVASVIAGWLHKIGLWLFHSLVMVN
ncbi:hypothetical protein QBC44DRAFT_319850 [Cladorrhinum sp. PSN332]|nr:hypothetical protein QBC44DRAFT_319850 [Cladorrhinum sp. PSN332]